MKETLPFLSSFTNYLIYALHVRFQFGWVLKSRLGCLAFHLIMHRKIFMRFTILGEPSTSPKIAVLYVVYCRYTILRRFPYSKRLRMVFERVCVTLIYTNSVTCNRKHNFKIHHTIALHRCDNEATVNTEKHQKCIYSLHKQTKTIAMPDMPLLQFLYNVWLSLIYTYLQCAGELDVWCTKSECKRGRERENRLQFCCNENVCLH